MAWIKKLFNYHSSLVPFGPNEPDHKKLDMPDGFFENVQFSFREGFSGRTCNRLEHILEINPEEIYYNSLSRLLPRITGFSFAAIAITIIVLIVLHGSLSPDKLIGADKIDDTNFITYLIMEK